MRWRSAELVALLFVQLLAAADAHPTTRAAAVAHSVGSLQQPPPDAAAAAAEASAAWAAAAAAAGEHAPDAAEKAEAAVPEPLKEGPCTLEGSK